MRPRSTRSKPLLLSLGTLCACGACSTKPDLPPIIAEEAIYDFQEQFSDARVEASNPSRRPAPGSLFIGTKRTQLKEGGNRPALILPPPAGLSFDLSLPDADCELCFSIGLGYDPARPSGRVQFDVLVGSQEVFSSSLSPGPHGEPVDWKEARVRLSNQRGRSVHITFRTSCSPEAASKAVSAGFAIPRVIRLTPYKRLPSGVDRLNVVIVLVDTMRADHLSCYGYSRPTTPNLDRLAAEGVLYRNAISQAPWTWPATASVLTSLYPQAHGVVGPDACYLAESIDTLPELLQREGYATYGVSANALICRAQNFSQGFETFEEAFRETADRITDRFTGWLSKHTAESFFAYLHYMDPHHPYAPPESACQAVAPEMFGADSRPALDRIRKGQENMKILQNLQEDREHIVALYDAEIRHWDTHFGRLVEGLRQAGCLGRTVIIVTSDHGEEFWDHGHFGHAKTLYQELVHVPLVVRCPRLAHPASVDTLVETIDIVPTICAALGVIPPRGIDGLRLPGLAGIPPPDRARSEAFSTTKLCWGNDSTGIRLFDLSADPAETRSLFEGQAGEAEALLRRLSAWQTANRNRAPLNRRPWLEKSADAQLEALGYVNANLKEGEAAKPPQEGVDFIDQQAIITPHLKLIRIGVSAR